MAITLDKLKTKCDHANTAMEKTGKIARLGVQRGNKGYNILIGRIEGYSTVAEDLTGKEADIWLDGFFTCIY